MPYIEFTQEQKEQANNTDLVSFLQMRGETLKPCGREYKLIYCDESGKHDSITINGSKWFDHKNQTGGGAVKFMQEFYGMTFPEVVQELLGCTIMPEYSRKYERSPPERSEPKKTFHLPERNQNMHRVYAYLIKSRFISPEIVDYFAHQHTLYEDAQYHNAVFVGLDENGIPRQAHKRSTVTFGESFRMTCTGSDTRYSFAHFGESTRLYVFEAPIDMLSFLTLYPQNWQEHSYIAMNGVYENAILKALETHRNLQKIVLCTDNDEGGIEAAYRLADILHEYDYHKISRILPEMKDFNEMLKALNGAEALPAVPHQRLQIYRETANSLHEIYYEPQNLSDMLREFHNRHEYTLIAESALAGSVFFLRKAGFSADFETLKRKLGREYRPHTDKGSKPSKWRNLDRKVMQSISLLYRGEYAEKSDVQTAKTLYETADCAVRMCAEEAMSAPAQEEEPEESQSQAYG